MEGIWKLFDLGEKENILAPSVKLTKPLCRLQVGDKFTMVLVRSRTLNDITLDHELFIRETGYDPSQKMTKTTLSWSQ